ncbi:cupin domain-containing protein [Vibrio alfacsensis]|uniref:Cupin domain-containing protein n=1 Tax=Vibrio alfacsensis TaxID=1074311 RepID=A0ABN5PH48_9VIBR|nr:cupin domain-containing protein [Vibrio alfacsensis]AXY02549.1 cupin domain-containing protein [Vibrio alfacsensis]
MNLLKDLPDDLSKEVFDDILSHKQVRIERIVSTGQTTPEGDWYDQEDHEWVLILQGAGELTYEDGSVIHLEVGDHTNIPAHTKHRVSWTAPDQKTIWLAVFYS